MDNDEEVILHISRNEHSDDGPDDWTISFNTLEDASMTCEDYRNEGREFDAWIEYKGQRLSY